VEKKGEQGEDRNKKRLLIVDDDDVDITNSFTLALKDSGLFIVDTYKDALAAFSNYKTKLL
jgi:hypothetical protein